MKPQDLRALLEKTKHRPEVYVLALVDRAELLIDLWEAIGDYWNDGGNFSRDIAPILDKLEAS